MPAGVILDILRAELQPSLSLEEISAWTLSGFFCDRGVKEWIAKATPFTAAMVSRQLPVSPCRGDMGRTIARYARTGALKRIGSVFVDYPEESGRTTCLWVAAS